MCEWGNPLEWSSRLPYMVNGLGLPFDRWTLIGVGYKLG
jgi:hypothetical protein